jgi:hypothetical protein
LTEKRPAAVAGRRLVAWVLFFAVLSLISKRAAAEKVLANVDGWQVYTDGRMGGFASYVHGQGYPQPTFGPQIDPATGQPAIDPTTGQQILVPVHTTLGGAGFTGAPTEQHIAIDPSLTPGTTVFDQGTIDTWRIRSGFIGNVLGFGVRGQLTENTKLTTYVQIWSFIENEGRARSTRSIPDVRQGWAKIEGPWGSFTAGRVRGLFSRGATDINVLYAHRWGVGWPGSIGNVGPTQGMVGFGVLGSGFSSALVYGTPSVAGLKLEIGAFDPAVLPAFGAWNGTKLPRAEAEATFERSFGDGFGKVVLFGNGAYQNVYKDGYCARMLDTQSNTYIECQETVVGAGYGGRLEVGPFHLGLAGHYGKGIGLNYALQADQAAQDFEGNLRKMAGWYAQAQVVIRKVDLFAGAGMAQIFLTEYDRRHRVPDPRDPTGMTLAEQWSVPKRQIGMTAGIVYNVSPFVHLDLDFFRAQADWYGANGFPPEKQVVYVANGGMTVNW